eukprot:145985-Chlamydomonas_euryale.AAC.1
MGLQSLKGQRTASGLRPGVADTKRPPTHTPSPRPTHATKRPGSARRPWPFAPTFCRPLRLRVHRWTPKLLSKRHA